MGLNYSLDKGTVPHMSPVVSVKQKLRFGNRTGGMKTLMLPYLQWIAQCQLTKTTVCHTNNNNTAAITVAYYYSYETNSRPLLNLLSRTHTRTCRWRPCWFCLHTISLPLSVSLPLRSATVHRAKQFVVACINSSCHYLSPNCAKVLNLCKGRRIKEEPFQHAPKLLTF